jgi:hypothetical protein
LSEPSFLALQSEDLYNSSSTFIKNLNEVEGKEKNRVEISNKFAALLNLDTEVDINRAWETIRENIKISAKESLDYYELKKQKQWFD